MHAIWVFLFAVTAGFTASGIIANLYRLLGPQKGKRGEPILRAAVMVVAGPSVIFESAMRARAAKEWKPVIFWLVVSGLGYWSLGIGLLAMNIALCL